MVRFQLRHSSATSLKTLCNRTALTIFRLLPLRVARHLMFLLRQNPAITDRWGYHVRPIHYYEPLPDFAQITAEQTRRRRPFPAIDFNLPGQVQLLQRLGRQYRGELEELARHPEPEGFNFQNDYFGGLDAAMCYALLRDLKPKQVIEIGSGNSTRIADKALKRNGAEGNAGKLACIEPFPERRLTEAKLDIELVARPVESLELGQFQKLQSGDVLFIDSSHAVKFGGDVCREYLEILPALAPGVWVHVHDIFFPHDYPAEWLMEKRIAFNEQYLLEAFLAYNKAFSVQAANHWLALDHPDVVEQLWPRLRNQSGYHGHASLWMRKNPGTARE